MPERKYKVGYCKPPVETRWGKKQSGNPKGRPRKSSGFDPDRDELTQLLFSKKRVTVGGQTVDIRRIDVLLQKQCKAALAGNYRIALELLRKFRGLEKRKRKLTGTRRWLTLPAVLQVPASVHADEIVDWQTLYGDAARAGLVPADRAGRQLVSPDWLRRELGRQNKGAPRPKQAPMDAAIERIFKTRVTVLRSGKPERVSLSKALYLMLIDMADESPTIMKSIDKMTEEARVVVADEEAPDPGEPTGCLILHEAPDTIEEWTRLYKDKADGTFARKLQEEWEATHGSL